MTNTEFSPAQSGQVKVGKFVFDMASSTLVSKTDQVKLEPLSFAFLSYLVQKPGQIISREELLEGVWGNRIVSDDSIRKVVKKLREALGDDAKSPTYIKTIPMKGYCLIAPIDGYQKSPLSVRLKVLSMLVLVVVVVAMAFAISFLQDRNELINNQISSTVPNIELLTNLSGSELDADYNAAIDTLIFSYRTNSNEPWQLYSKDQRTGLVKRLTWEQGNFIQARIAPEGTRLAYWRISESGSAAFISDFNQEQGLSNTTAVTQNKRVKGLLSWSVDGKALYVNNVESGSGTQSIFRLTLSDQVLQQLTFPNVEGFGDYLAQESPDGKYLTVMRNVSDRNYVMLILELSTMKVLIRQPLTFYADSIVWQSNSDTMAISSFKGDFYYFSVASGQLVEQAGSTPSINDVFYACGENCFYMRQHTMNYTDIREIPNPFIDGSNLPTLHIESDNAEFHPTYNLSGKVLYYTSKDKERASVIRHVLGEKPEILHSFNPRYLVTDISLNKQETLLLGKVEDRIFILNIETRELKFITTALEIVGNPTWKRSGEGIYFSRVEQHRQVMLDYDIPSDSLTRKEKGIIHLKELADGRIFVVDEQKGLYQVMPDSNRLFITRLPRTSNNYWHIQKNYLYFSHDEKNKSYLSRIDMTTGHKEVQVMAENVWIQGFNLHPEGRKLLIVQSLLADSNLVKVNWQ